MADAKLLLLARPVEAWRLCDPKAMATRQSPAAIEFGFADAKHDILALSEINAELLAALQAAEQALNKIRVCCHHTAWDATGPVVIAARAVIAKVTGAAS